MPRRGARAGLIAFAVVAAGLLANTTVAEDLRPADTRLPKIHLSHAGSIQVSTSFVRATGVKPDSASMVPRSIRPGGNFLETDLVRRLSHQLEPVAPLQPVVAPTSTSEFIDHPLLQHVTDSARLRAERGTRRALSNFLLEATSLDKLVFTVKRKGSKGLGGVAGNAMKFGVGVYHGRPRLEMRYLTGPATLRLRVDAFGGAGIEVNHSRRSYSRCYIGYDNIDHEYDVAYRFSF